MILYRSQQFNICFLRACCSRHTAALRSVLLLFLVPKGTGLPLTLLLKQRTSSLTERIRSTARQCGQHFTDVHQKRNWVRMSYQRTWVLVLLVAVQHRWFLLCNFIQDWMLAPLSIKPLPTQVSIGDPLPALGSDHATSRINRLRIRCLGIVEKPALCMCSLEIVWTL